METEIEFCLFGNKDSLVEHVKNKSIIDFISKGTIDNRLGITVPFVDDNILRRYITKFTYESVPVGYALSIGKDTTNKVIDHINEHHELVDTSYVRKRISRNMPIIMDEWKIVFFENIGFSNELSIYATTQFSMKDYLVDSLIYNAKLTSNLSDEESTDVQNYIFQLMKDYHELFLLQHKTVKDLNNYTYRIDALTSQIAERFFKGRKRPFIRKLNENTLQLYGIFTIQFK